MAMNIGFIGLGVMGAPMATHLARAGHRLALLDVNAATARDLAATLGGEASAVTTPREVAERSDVIITMLPNGRVVRSACSLTSEVRSVVTKRASCCSGCMRRPPSVDAAMRRA
jgi:3-hydroxyisobutyrate dehydrogenase-like beta-hydroxyacid dehydrogenase